MTPKYERHDFRSSGQLDPIIVVQDICKTRNHNNLVRNLSFEVCRGEIVGVVGHCGAGKNAMFSLISGTTSPTSGQILFEGEDVTHLAHKCRERRGIAATLPLERLADDLTTIDNLLLHGLSAMRPLFPREGGETDIDEAFTLLKLVGLEGDAHEKASTLAAGKKWLLTIAIALARRPSLLLLIDCGVIGNKMTKTVRELLNEIVRNGTSIIFAARSWHPVMEVCNRIEILRKGEIVACSSERDSLLRSTYSQPAPVKREIGLGRSILQQFLKRGLLLGRTRQKSEREYSRS